MARKITIPEGVSKHIPNVSIPEMSVPKVNVPKVTIPDEARRPLYATVGAAEVAVERVRDAVVTIQGRFVDTQKSLSDKAATTFGENMTSASKTASSAYAEFTRRGEETVGRIWPDAVKTEAPAKVAKPKSTTKTAPKKRTAPKAAPAKATAPKSTVKATAPKATATKVTPAKTTTPKAATTPAEAKTADKPASE